MSTLKIMIGIPGSGKTSYARSILQNESTVYLSSDQIRIDMFGYESQTDNEKVFNRMRNETLLALKSGYDVIYDATNLSKKRRKTIITETKKLDAEVEAYLFCTPINIILERNIIRSERKLPWDKLEQMIKSIEVPMYYEGFDNIYLIDGESFNGCGDVYDYSDLIKRCRKYNQGNPYHDETLEEHIVAVTKRAEELGEELKLKIDSNILRQAARYHDFGKMYTKMYREDKQHYVYYGHEKVSAYMYLCHIKRSNMYDNLFRTRLCDSHYQTATLILNHMEWYRRDDMTPIKEMFNDDDLYHMLELLHEADIWGRNENAEVIEIC